MVMKLPPRTVDFFIDNIAKKNLDEVRYRVLKKDFDFVSIIDGREGSGKSVLAQQLASYLDPNFTLDNIVFTSTDFIAKIKDPKVKKGSCIILDEAFNAINSRASMSEVNKSMGAVATEMRQKNLFIFIVLPSFFDLDKQFAIHRASSLIHVYLKDNVDRGQYLIFPRSKKLYLYLFGKKTYNYSKPKCPFPPCRFTNRYTVDENEYRLKKSKAFTKRTVSNQAKNWLNQRNAYIKYLHKILNLTQEELGKIPSNFGVVPVSSRSVGFIVEELIANADI